MINDLAAVTTSARRALTDRKWIDRRVDHLDPEVDYAEIVRLSTLYGQNALTLHWFYAVGTPAAGLAPHVMDAVWRSGTGKYNTKPTTRVNDSVDHLMVWFEHGANAPATAKSVEMVNKYHAHFASEYPSSFADPEDYIYILCLNATEVFSAMRLIGLPGLSEKQKRAFYVLWSQLARHFTMANGTPVTDLATFPADFDSMVRYVEHYQARPWPVHPPGHDSTTSAIEHFASRFFPPPLRWFGRALVTSFMAPAVLRAHSIVQPPQPLSWLARRFMKVMMLTAKYILPDDQESLPDRRRRLGATDPSAMSVVDTAVHRLIGAGVAAQGPARGCPHMSMTGVYRNTLPG